ncbi:hypothetical protein [Duganella vulcania]|uniref:Uncharacterized protein n=1 Tax=Duganella vulcania TaxID=2692166 RepID=A0A845GDJ5_9BURK|nr:hypothetical protein [Duganella vulcania]MYM92693.1 hypothetical protein [Duganella vulcania]
MTRRTKESAEHFIRLRMNPELHPFLQEHLLATVTRKNWGAALLNLAAIGLATSRLQPGAARDHQGQWEADNGATTAPPSTEKPNAPAGQDQTSDEHGAEVEQITLSADDFNELSSVFNVSSTTPP